MRAICLAHYILIALISMIIFGEASNYEIFLSLPLLQSKYSHHPLLEIPLSCSSFNKRDKVSHA